MDVTNPDWAPTLHMGHGDIPVSDLDQHSRRTQRKQRKRAPIAGNPPPSKNILNCYHCTLIRVSRAEVIDEDLTEDQQQNHNVMEAVDSSCVGQVEVEVAAANVDSGHRTDSVTEAKGQTKDCVCNEQSRAEINRLLDENRLLRAQLQKTELNESFLKDDTEKVRYYTGLHCYAVLMSLFNTVKDFLPISKKLTGFQMLLLTLMCLRLDLPVQHLCHPFDVSHKTLSSVFTDTIDVLYARLGALVHRPERHCLQATMPPQPSNLKARAQTYSHYKAISFISRGWGGRASDKHITERCGILQKLLPGDVVLADRGFDIRNAVGMMCAEVKIPAFTKGYCQLDVRDVEQTRATAHLRIHVELKTTLLDKIVKVCCVFVNMCPSVVVKPGPNDTRSC
uniref:DDE Tnp4 domain-containing protein n=1 Tax=Haplochromis burtoni TaxID=8153 RepID=A0A3Q3C6K2_HAPBU